MNARYYDPHLGSFITPDPATANLNHYAYCSANPVKYTDPTGLTEITPQQAIQACGTSGRSVLNEINNLINLINSENYTTTSKSELQDKYFNQIINIFSGFGYGGNGNGFDNNWNKVGDKSVCIDLVKDTLRVLLNPGGTPLPDLASDKKSNGIEIAGAFGLSNLGMYKPSELENLPKNNIYVITFFEKDFKSGDYKDEAGKFKNQTWFNEFQHVKTVDGKEYGTKHVGLLKYEDKKLNLIHQSGGSKNVENFKNTKYNDDDKYITVVNQVTQGTQDTTNNFDKNDTTLVW